MKNLILIFIIICISLYSQEYKRYDQTGKIKYNNSASLLTYDNQMNYLQSFENKNKALFGRFYAVDDHTLYSLMVYKIGQKEYDALVYLKWDTKEYHGIVEH